MWQSMNTRTDPGIQMAHVTPTWLPTFSHFCHRHPAFRNVTSFCHQTKYKYYEIYDISHVIWSHFYGVTTWWWRTPWWIGQNLQRCSTHSKHHKCHDTGVNVTSYKPIEKYVLSYIDSHKIHQWSAALFADMLYQFQSNRKIHVVWRDIYFHLQSKDFHCTDFHEIRNGIKHF